MTFDPDPLAEQADRLRRLAHQLIPDREDAEDASQEAALAYLTKRPQGLRDPRAWLAGALRLERLRWLQRRPRRAVDKLDPDELTDERAPALDAAVSELLALVEREVCALEEPYASVLRSTLLEERSLHATARALDRNPATVRSQHLRGLQLLRERLDRHHGGDRRAWLGALLPWLRPEHVPAPVELAAKSWSGLRPVVTWVTLPLVALLVWTQFLRSGATLEPVAPLEVAGAGPEVLDARESVRLAAEVPQPADESSSFPVLGAPSAPPGPGEPAASGIAGVRRFGLRVVDEQGLGLAGASVRLLRKAMPSDPFSDPPQVDGEELARSGADGRAVVDVRPEQLEVEPNGFVRGRLSVRLEGFLEEGQHLLRWDPDEPDGVNRVESTLSLRSAPHALEFRILDATDGPVEDAQVGVYLTARDRGLPLAEELTLEPGLLVLSGSAGAPPRLASCPPGTHRLTVWSPTRGMTHRSVEVTSSGTVEVRLEDQRIVRGVVYDEGLRPDAGATVWSATFRETSLVPWAWCSTTTDADGRYELRVGDARTLDLWAAHPARDLHPVNVVVDTAPGVLEGMDVYLRNQDPIELRLVDPRGLPLARWRVGLFVVLGNETSVHWRLTETDGWTRFPGVRADRLRLSVYGETPGRFPALLVVDDYRPQPGVDELVVELAHAETAALLGLVSTSGWTPEVPLSICYADPGSPTMDQHTIAEFGEPFAIEDLSPGAVNVMLLGGKTLLRPLGQHTLEPGGFVDLGEILLEPPGTVSFAAEPAGSLEGVVAFARLSSLATATTDRAAIGFDGWPGEIYPFLAGDYRMVFACGEQGTRMVEFSVRSGEHTQVVVER